MKIITASAGGRKAMREDLLKEQGIRLLNALQQRRFKQTDLARAAGVSAGFISDICHGKRAPSEKVLAALKQLTGVDPAWILRGAIGSEAAPLAPSPSLAPVTYDCSPAELIASAVAMLNYAQTEIQHLHQGELHDLLSRVLQQRPDVASAIKSMLEAMIGDIPNNGRSNHDGRRSA